MTYLPKPDYLETEPRYTTVQAVKVAMGIDDTALDNVIKEAIVTIETLIDSYLGTSYPQDPPPIPAAKDPLDPAPIVGIPVQLGKAAKLGAIKLVKLDDAPLGGGGSDEFFGVVEVDTATTAFNAIQALLVGLRRSWGIG